MFLYEHLLRVTAQKTFGRVSKGCKVLDMTLVCRAAELLLVYLSIYLSIYIYILFVYNHIGATLVRCCGALAYIKM